ncbi:MAG: glycosyltransferase family 4 protein [Blastocatellia bacterium]|nr:glycosyltransferase family 4 protein [Blastocatellia bacterium]
MKIAFVVHDFHRKGGHSRYTVELAERFAREHEVHVFANRIEDAGASAPLSSDSALRVAALTTILSFPLPATAALGRGFDVVHAQGFVCAGANVITAHICNATWYDARRRSADEIRATEHLFAAIVNRLERRLFRGSTKAEVIAVSNRVASDLRTAYGRTDRVSVIYHGVDLDRFSPRNRDRYRSALRQSLGIPEDALVALYVGDLRKGGRTAIEALTAAPAWRLLTVSRSSPELYAAYAEARRRS